MADALAQIQPRVCVLVPVYNGERTIGETIASVLAQTYSNFEVIVVDNCSTDGTVAVVESFQDPRLSLVKNSSNLGSYGNLDRCIQLCRGDLTAIFHADDVYTPNILQAQVDAFLQHPEVGLVFTHAALINQDGASIGQVDMPMALLRRPVAAQDQASILKLLMKHGNFTITPSAMVRTEIYKNLVKWWNVDLFDTGADLGAWLQILEHHKALVLPDLLMNYRLSKSQHSYHINKLRTTRSDFFKVIDVYVERPHLRAQLSPQDLKDYRSLERTDRMIRSLNFLLKGQPREAGRLAAESLSAEAWVEAIRSFRGLKTFLLGMTLRLGVLLKAEAALSVFFKRLHRYR